MNSNSEPWWHPDRFQPNVERLRARQAVVSAVRRYFLDQGFDEVETPLLQVTPGLDTHIMGFETNWQPHGAEPRQMFLHTSPEFAMKKLLVAGMTKIFQITKAFRNETVSSMHSPEFSLVEWYRANEGYEQLMEDCIGLMRAVASINPRKIFEGKGVTSEPFQEWQKISVQDAFLKYADVDLFSTISPLPLRERSRSAKRDEGEGKSFNCKPSPKFANANLTSPEMGEVEALRQEAERIGIRTADDDRWDDIFFRIFDDKIEHNLGHPVPTILYDYPISMAALSRQSTRNPAVCERFEIYICKTELANAFGELTDPVIQRNRFIEDMDKKQEIYGHRYPMDEDFLAALERGMPDASGIALGLDRLAMLATGADHINQVLWAPVC